MEAAMTSFFRHYKLLRQSVCMSVVSKSVNITKMSRFRKKLIDHQLKIYNCIKRVQYIDRNIDKLFSICQRLNVLNTKKNAGLQGQSRDARSATENLDTTLKPNRGGVLQSTKMVSLIERVSLYMGICMTFLGHCLISLDPWYK